MELKLIKAAWGMTGSWDEKLSRIAKAGYNGIETPLTTVEDDVLFKELLEKYQLDLIVQVFSGSRLKPYPSSAEEHVASLESQVARAAKLGPILINAHSAKDSMPYRDQLDYFAAALEMEKQMNVAIAHETHRGRATFTPWSTARLLEDMPGLRIVADFSHWCCVCESMLQGQEEHLSLAIRHTVHIHGRVGYEQGPQVPDFRAPEYEYTLSQHEQWWDDICACHQAAGSPYLTFTPEFGPAGYMHLQPYTKQPVVDLWDICFAMGERFRHRFASK